VEVGGCYGAGAGGGYDNDQNILATNCVYNCKAFAVCAAGAAELDPLPPRETFPLLNNTILRAGQSTPLKDAVPLPLSNYTSATFTVSWWAGLPCAGSLHVYTSPDGAHWDTVPRQSFDFVQTKGEVERWQETTALCSAVCPCASRLKRSQAPIYRQATWCPRCSESECNRETVCNASTAYCIYCVHWV
jgi:hypothetical protein